MMKEEVAETNLLLIVEVDFKHLHGQGTQQFLQQGTSSLINLTEATITRIIK